MGNKFRMFLLFQLCCIWKEMEVERTYLHDLYSNKPVMGLHAFSL